MEEIKVARALGDRPDILAAAKAMLQDKGGYRMSDLDSLTENLTANFDPEFAAGVYEYSLAAENAEDEVNLTATLEEATILYSYGEVEDKEVESGVAETVPLAVGENVITIKVHQPGYGPVAYTITVTRAAGA